MIGGDFAVSEGCSDASRLHVVAQQLQLHVHVVDIRERDESERVASS